MNKDSDLILGVLSGQNYHLQYPGVGVYLESIKRSGYSGNKVMLTWNINSNTKSVLTQFGFEVVDLDPWPSEPFFIARVHAVRDFLEKRHKEYRFVHWLDIKDLLLQSCPSEWLENNIGNHSLVGSSESVSIFHEETNWMWANAVLGSDKALELKDKTVINGGTFSGRSEAMYEVFKQAYELCKDYTGPYPPCQLSFAYAMHIIFGKDLVVPKWEQGYAACLHPFWSPWRTPCAPFLNDKPPVLEVQRCILYPGKDVYTHSNQMIKFNDRWGMDKRMEIISAVSGPLHGIACVSPPEYKPFAIVHGYDREWTLKAMFEYKYRFDGDFSLDRFKAEQEARFSQQRMSFRRELRRVDAGTVGNNKLQNPARVFRRSS